MAPHNKGSLSDIEVILFFGVTVKYNECAAYTFASTTCSTQMDTDGIVYIFNAKLNSSATSFLRTGNWSSWVLHTSLDRVIMGLNCNDSRSHFKPPPAWEFLMVWRLVGSHMHFAATI